MPDTTILRSTALSTPPARHRLRAGMAAIRAWLTAEGEVEKALIADLDRHHRDMHMLQGLGMTRGEVARMIDRGHR